MGTGANTRAESGDPRTGSGDGGVVTSDVPADDQLRRALADLDNLRKRFAREVARERLAERVGANTAWVPVVDHLELALSHRGPAGGPRAGAVIEGLKAVRDEAVDLLARAGFPRYEDVGQPFDPARHEAVGVVEAPPAPGTVVAVVRPGYGSDDIILRPAHVIVAQGPPEPPKSTDGAETG
jgi:molecular chaperone GrpE